MSKHMTKMLAVLAVLVAAPLSAQTPTPEGTVITNTVSVSYTDANSNTYSDATAAVNVTVGFLGALDVTSSATASPSSPSTANNLNFTINNIGNGPDSVSVTATASAGLTITGYKIGATTYADLTALNAALAGMAITAGSSVVVTVVYNVASAMGGETLPLSLTATSRRDGTKTDASTTNVVPPVFGGVTVTADVATINRLPTGSAGAYSTTFTVSNGANSSRTFTLTGNVTGSGTVLGTVNGGTSTVTIAANSTASVTVTYTVGPSNIAANTVGAVTLKAAAQDDPTNVQSTGTHTVTVIRAALTLTKEAFRQNQSTIIGAADRVLPGETIWYKLTITNTGAAAAHTLALTDQLPAQVTYVSNSAPGAWTVTYNAGTTTVSANLTGTLAASASNVIWVQVTVK